MLGAIPMGWLADRMKRVPIVGSRRPALGAVLHDARRRLGERASCSSGCICFTGIAKANDIAVHPPLLADNYPIGIRARMSACMNIGQQVLGNLSPVLVGSIARRAARRHRGLALGVRRARHPRRARRARSRSSCKEPPRGPVREGRRARRGHRGREPRAAVDGGGVRAAEEDRDDPHVDRRVRGARLRRSSRSAACRCST